MLLTSGSITNAVGRLRECANLFREKRPETAVFRLGGIPMEKNRKPIRGIHHITAIASSAAENLRFYTEVLGLRLVKKTVNFDDPTTYHLYYGNGSGTPGTIMTFFPWENMPPGHAGAGMISAVAFAVPSDAETFWSDRLSENGFAVEKERRFNEPVLRFKDPHGLFLELVGVETEPDIRPWTQGEIAGRFAIRGFHSATALTNDGRQPRKVLEKLLGMRRVGSEGSRTRFAMAEPSAPGGCYDLVEDPTAPRARPGGGTVHHIAFRTENEASQRTWHRRISDFGLDVTPVIDRNYFRSIYFRETGGILFEIATDPPGFAVDEPEERLGSSLMLPPQYEKQRERIERHLPPLDGADAFRHLFVAPEGSGTGKTLLALHGTGGDERDLVPLARRIGGRGTAVLSPRGRVSENGMNRFFSRLADGVFDPAEVRRRALELADFIADSAGRYRLDSSRIAAFGYSNGANIAAAVMLLRPEVFSEAILLRPMMPFETYAPPDLSGRRVLVARGRFDDVIPAASTDRLVAALSAAGAQVTEVALDSDHRLTAEDIALAENWWANCTAQLCAVSAAGA